MLEGMEWRTVVGTGLEDLLAARSPAIPVEAGEPSDPGGGAMATAVAESGERDAAERDAAERDAVGSDAPARASRETGTSPGPRPAPVADTRRP